MKWSLCQVCGDRKLAGVVDLLYSGGKMQEIVAGSLPRFRRSQLSGQRRTFVVLITLLPPSPALPHLFRNVANCPAHFPLPPLLDAPPMPVDPSNSRFPDPQPLPKIFPTYLVPQSPLPSCHIFSHWFFFFTVSHMQMYFFNEDKWAAHT